MKTYGYDSDYGIGGDASMSGMARYVAVGNVRTELQNLDLDL